MLLAIAIIEFIILILIMFSSLFFDSNPKLSRAFFVAFVYAVVFGFLFCVLAWAFKIAQMIF